MSATPELSGILADLAAGRIDAAEASRRIEAVNQQADEDRAEQDATSEPASAPTPDQGAGEEDTAGEGMGAGAGDTPSGAQAGSRGFFDESWNRVPPEAREGLRSAWKRVTGVAESVVDAAGGATGSPRPGQRGPGGTDEASHDTVTRLSVRCVGRRVTIIGDPATPGVQVEGKHNRRRIGDIVEITSEGRIAPDLSGLLRLRFPKDSEGLKDLGLGPELVIRMHPDLALDVELAGGALRLSGVPDVDSVRVTAAVADIADIRHIGEALFQAGGSTLVGPIDTGRSRIRVESGNLTVKLAAGSNVAVRADARPGLISWPDGGSSVDEYIVGNGSARMDMSTVMGRIAVRTV
ncbi:hypothetical protein [Acidipropionibacterium virtanenii]|uniref:Adhesin domain-containing protein n=1 Tax=Acidipropionibacterium virtanenii TaxID=2057246 RepID=A0A344UVY1_9ACTN|nr:hypothetical protein [Acidipropionibacterium virtanenii]AXE39429.1 hypothetical protein JS278_02277 [Acidipropionibacterium virtanenii]